MKPDALYGFGFRSGLVAVRYSSLVTANELFVYCSFSHSGPEVAEVAVLRTSFTLRLRWRSVCLTPGLNPLELCCGAGIRLTGWQTDRHRAVMSLSRRTEGRGFRLRNKVSDSRDKSDRLSTARTSGALSRQAGKQR